MGRKLKVSQNLVTKRLVALAEDVQLENAWVGDADVEAVSAEDAVARIELSESSVASLIVALLETAPETVKGFEWSCTTLRLILDLREQAVALIASWVVVLGTCGSLPLPECPSKAAIKRPSPHVIKSWGSSGSSDRVTATSLGLRWWRNRRRYSGRPMMSE